MRKTRKALAIVLVLFFLFFSLPAKASVSCLVLSNDLTVGSTGTGVTSLQQFLQSQGLYTYPTYTGYFGTITKTSVINFQAGHGISPTGYVGPITRGFIASYTCDGSGAAGQSFLPGCTATTIYSTLTGVKCDSINNPLPSNPAPYNPCLFSCVNSGAVSLASISPSAGAVGSQVTLYGNGFTSTGNTIEINGSILANNLPSNGTTIVFQVPYTYTGQLQCHGDVCSSITSNLVAGTYPLTVVNSKGTSNSQSFTVTSLTNASYTPSITLVTGPSTIKTGVSGSWNVAATDPQNSTLVYAADWGETTSSSCPPGYISQPDGYGGYTCQYAPNGLGNVQFNGLFSHTYTKAGTYTATFTVSNLSSLKATRSIQVAVTTG